MWNDTEPPLIEQVRLVDGQILVELSEEIRKDPLQNLEHALYNTTRQLEIGITYDLPVDSGRRARHRIVITPDPDEAGDLQDGDELQLQIPAEALTDLFGNQQMTASAPIPLTWSSTGSPPPFFDGAAPRLLDACVIDGVLRLQFSETPDMAQATSRSLLDGATTSWTLLGDGYTLELVSLPSTGESDHGNRWDRDHGI